MPWGLSAAHVDDNGHTAGAAAGNQPSERCRAVRAVASRAVDAAEAAELIEMLGLIPAEGRKAVDSA